MGGNVTGPDMTPSHDEDGSQFNINGRLEDQSDACPITPVTPDSEPSIEARLSTLESLIGDLLTDKAKEKVTLDTMAGALNMLVDRVAKLEKTSGNPKHVIVTHIDDENPIINI